MQPEQRDGPDMILEHRENEVGPLTGFGSIRTWVLALRSWLLILNRPIYTASRKKIHLI